jgi:HEAT repeat protein
MRVPTTWILLLCLLAGVGCSKQKSTPELIGDLKSPMGGDRVVAARLLQNRKGDPAQVVPALIEALKDKENDVRWSAAIGLGYFGDKATEALPALKEAELDKDARVREAARVAISRIKPS